MFSLHTPRLRLIPLNLHQLLLYQSDYPALCQELDLLPLPILLEEVYQAEFNDALVNYWIPQVAANVTHYRWFTNWLIVEKNTQSPVGGIGIAGLPVENDETEIGYGIGIAHRQKGYATEALIALSEWTLGHAFIKAVIAHTPVALLASQRVLEKAQFERVAENDGIVLWRKRQD